METADRTYEQIRDALAAFGLPAPETVRLIPEGLMNRNWEVAAGGARYALKEVVDVGPDAARRQHAATRALAAAKLPVPGARTTTDGDTLAATGGHFYALTPWAAGQMLPARSWSREQAAAVGVLLAELHAELAGTMPSAPGTVPVTVTPPLKAAARIADYLRQARAAGRDGFDGVVQQALAEREVLLERWADARAEDGERGPAGWTHGDFHDLNLLWRGGSVSAVLDWDRLGVRPYADEVVRTATLPVMFGAGEGPLDLELVAAFVGGYRKASGLPAVVLREAAERQRWERICDVWQLKVHYGKGDTSCDHLFRAASAVTGWWCRNRQLVADALTAAD